MAGQAQPTVTAAMNQLGLAKEAVTRVQSVQGGCISSAYKYTTDSGKSVFVKIGHGLQPLQSEAAGLNAMSATNTIPVPRPLFVGKIWQRPP